MLQGLTLQFCNVNSLTLQNCNANFGAQLLKNQWKFSFDFFSPFQLVLSPTHRHQELHRSPLRSQTVGCAAHAHVPILNAISGWVTRCTFTQEIPVANQLKWVGVICRVKGRSKRTLKRALRIFQPTIWQIPFPWATMGAWKSQNEYISIIDDHYSTEDTFVRRAITTYVDNRGLNRHGALPLVY